MKAPLAILIAILVFALAFSAGCTQQKTPDVNVTQTEPNTTQNASANGTVQEQPCSGGNVVQNDACFAALAKADDDPAYCQNIYSIGTMDSCYEMFANGSLGICKKITDAQMRWNCLLQNALSEKSDTTCKLIENDSMRAACLEAVVPPCTLIMDEGARTLCLALYNSNYGLCTTDGCLAAYAQNKSDPAACGGISAESARYACDAIVGKDVTLCQQAAQTPVQDACIENASIALDKPNGCDIITPGSTYANICHLHFAFEYSDPSYCQKPFQEEQRDQCYSDYANLTANISTCPKVINTLNRIVCYRVAAIGNRMPSLCNNIGTSSNARDCYAASILYLDAGPVPSDCQNVADSTWKDKCYLYAAIKTNNGAYCSLIGEGPDKTDCDGLFGTQ